MFCYLVKDDGLSYGCGKHDNCNDIAKDGSGTSNDPRAFVFLVFGDVRQKGAQEKWLKEGQAVLKELEKPSDEIRCAIGYEQGSP